VVLGFGRAMGTDCDLNVMKGKSMVEVEGSLYYIYVENYTLTVST
jgi:hypothetical protein